MTEWTQCNTLAKAEVDRVTRKSHRYAVAGLAYLVVSLWFFLKGRKTQEIQEVQNPAQLYNYIGEKIWLQRNQGLCTGGGGKNKIL